MIILSADRASRRKIELCVDGGCRFLVEEDAWGACCLSSGDEISQEQLDLLLAQSYHTEAKRRALSLLSTRSYTGRQLKERLAPTTGAQAAEAAVERMAELGLVDDAAYARRLACELYEHRSYGPRRIRMELHKRGVASAFIDAALTQFDPDLDPNRAAALLRSRYPSVSGERERRRAMAFLERHGYDAASIRAALGSVQSDETEEQEWNTELE